LKYPDGEYIEQTKKNLFDNPPKDAQLKIRLN